VAAQPTTILILEDEPAHAEAICRALKDARPHFDLRVGGSLRQFRDLIGVQSPDLAILDLLLPDGRAGSVLSSPPESGPFPIVVMSSHGDEHIAVAAMQSGALDYVVKSPEAFADMPHTVDRALRAWSVLVDRGKAQEALRLSEERLRLATEAARMGTWECDLKTGRLIWSESEERLMGYEPGTFPGTTEAYAALLHPDSVEVHAAAQKRALTGDGTFEAELQFKLRDGRERWGMLRGCAISDSEGQPIRLVGVDVDITTKKQADVQLQRYSEQLRALSARLESLREAERTRIAREIHDELGQLLTALRMDLHWIERELDSAGNQAPAGSLLEKVLSATSWWTPCPPQCSALPPSCAPTFWTSSGW
jgi:two-component system sensor histidine kinase UhpB